MEESAPKDAAVQMRCYSHHHGHRHTVAGASNFKCFCCQTMDEMPRRRSVFDSLLNGRKWLPFRTSQSKPPLVKKTSEKNIKSSTAKPDDEHYIPPPLLSHAVPSVAGMSGHYGSSAASSHHHQQQADFEPEEEAELPPPMKPIQEPHIIATGGQQTFAKDNKDNASNMANAGKMDGNPSVDEIEQIVKEKTKNFRGGNVSNEKGGDTNGRSCDPSGGIDLSSGSGEGYERSGSSCNNEMLQNNTESDVIKAALKKRSHVLAELISSEETYVKDLENVVVWYIQEMRNPSPDIPVPETFKGKDLLVFGNIRDIYEWHRDYFLGPLRNCKESPDKLGPLIKRSQAKLQYLYKVYCQNKPLAEYIVKEYSSYFYRLKDEFKHSLGLPDYLIKPVQRVTKYVLLLEEIKVASERARLTNELDSLKQAIDVMRLVCKDVNNMMELRNLQNFDGRVTHQGQLLKFGILTCCEETSSDQKPRELQVFLFEQSIIFADVLHKGKMSAHSSPTYIYRTLIQVNKMQLTVLPNNKFQLSSTDPNGPALKMVCYAATIDVNDEWLKTLQNMLKDQNDFLNALTRPQDRFKSIKANQQPPSSASAATGSTASATTTTATNSE